MRKEKWTIIIMFFLIVCFIFQNNINTFLVGLDKTIDNDTFMYDEYLKKEIDGYLKNANMNELPDVFLVMSKVKYRNVYKLFDEVTIYKGSNDGIEVGNAVLNNDGLVGVISQVNKESSVVKLITNKNSNISVEINGVYGTLGYFDDVLNVSSANTGDINEGDKVYTSGLGNLPGGIYIGEVTSKKMYNNDLELRCNVDVGLNVGTLNYLYVARWAK